jgi:hypothetical protein
MPTKRIATRADRPTGLDQLADQLELEQSEKLLDAAHELLDALIAMRAQHQIDEPHHAELCQYCRLADAAIAKATGRS